MRTDGPPFYDIKAKQGEGFEVDFERLSKYLGPGKVSAERLFFSAVALRAAIALSVRARVVPSARVVSTAGLDVAVDSGHPP